jgi:GrpB-like predicted nucleotidyltransferase (UPF0157 family)
MSKLGLKTGTVRLSRHHPSWKKLYEAEEMRIRKLLGSYVGGIEHIGSTAVPGLRAKPIIDMLIGVRDVRSRSKTYIKLFKSEGYLYSPKSGRNVPPLFFKKGNSLFRTHNIHVVPYKGSLWNKRLMFRDYLRAHPERAKQYVNLKDKLAKQFPDDRESYTLRKQDFIEKTLKLAKQNK